MADRALTEEAVLRGLQDIRLPADAPGGALAEALAALGVALTLAILIGLLLRLITRPPTRPTAKTVQDQIAALATLPDDTRQLALLHLLKQNRPEAFKVFRTRLYAPGGTPDPKSLETELAGHD